jgi:hypothetical protein
MCDFGGSTSGGDSSPGLTTGYTGFANALANLGQQIVNGGQDITGQTAANQAANAAAANQASIVAQNQDQLQRTEATASNAATAFRTTADEQSGNPLGFNSSSKSNSLGIAAASTAPSGTPSTNVLGL